jgi:hypothetical protein
MKGWITVFVHFGDIVFALSYRILGGTGYCLDLHHDIFSSDEQARDWLKMLQIRSLIICTDLGYDN